MKYIRFRGKEKNYTLEREREGKKKKASYEIR
jgi:hypothetical protein